MNNEIYTNNYLFSVRQIKKYGNEYYKGLIFKHKNEE